MIVEAYCPECEEIRSVCCARCGAAVLPSQQHELAEAYAQSLYERFTAFRDIVRQVRNGTLPVTAVDEELRRQED